MPVSLRERKYKAMRVIDEWVYEQRRQELLHRPPWGTIGVGGSDFDFLLKATVGEAYLRILRCGGTPQEAHAEAVKDGSECVARWNISGNKTRATVTGRHEIRRWEKAGEAVADSLHVQYLTLVGLRHASITT